MADKTNISWCDASFNCWIGCSKVSHGCKNCYAEADMDKRRGRVKWGPHGTRSMTSADYWKKPILWNKKAKKEGVRRRVFCASLSDVFEDWKMEIRDHLNNILHRCPDGHMVYFDSVRGNGIDCADCDKVATPLTMNDVRIELFGLIDVTPLLDWLLLTKRPENIRVAWHWRDKRDSTLCLHQDYRQNCWLGTSVENQETADKRIPELLKCRDLSPVLWLSCEPLLEEIDITPYLSELDWVVIGGESGPGARPFLESWAQLIIEQCNEAGVPVFMKQYGSNSIGLRGWPPVSGVRPLIFKSRKGDDPEEWPGDMQIREWPNNKQEILS